ncbi:hypothetical protein GCM10020254_78730 [Streptomyces goshikiensis]
MENPAGGRGYVGGARSACHPVQGRKGVPPRAVPRASEYPGGAGRQVCGEPQQLVSREGEVPLVGDLVEGQQGAVAVGEGRGVPRARCAARPRGPR